MVDLTNLKYPNLRHASEVKSITAIQRCPKMKLGALGIILGIRDDASGRVYLVKFRGRAGPVQVTESEIAPALTSTASQRASKIIT